jgi:hypothetical protein
VKWYGVVSRGIFLAASTYVAALLS